MIGSRGINVQVATLPALPCVCLGQCLDSNSGSYCPGASLNKVFEKIRGRDPHQSIGNEEL